MAAGSARRRFGVTGLVAALACGAVAAACAPSGGGQTAPEDPYRRQVAASLVEGVVVPTLVSFASDAAALQTATAALAAAPADEAALAGARDAWREAMLTWQRAEVMQLGPAAASGTAVGAADLRDEIYSWPLRNECRVDQLLVSGGFETAASIGAEPTNVRGLDALEYLLFHPADNACAPNATINRDGLWAAIDEAEMARRRAEYAAAVATTVRAGAEALVAAWQDGFTTAVAEAGRAGSPYRSVAEALNGLSDAMFYLEKETKDLKLGPPIGLIDCATATCPERLELRWSNLSREAIGENLAGFAMMFRGADDGLGFDDLLDHVGASEVRQQMEGLLATADATFAATAAPFEQTLATDPASLRVLYDALKSIVDFTKTQFVGVLDLEIPQRAEGDND